jgi:RNA polymerase Rpb1, domain 4/RNA polymerase Rpb1, domain 3/Intein splicing domain/LAGLIDADG-like domain
LFDGDEMNLFNPVGINANIECREIMAAKNHIVSAQANKPIVGIIQEALISSFILTNTDVQVPWHIAFDCFFQIEKTDIKEFFSRGSEFWPECVDCNGQRLSETCPGKLFISIIFPSNFFFKKTTDTNSLCPKVRIQKGILLKTSGPLCSKVIGSKTNSIIHQLWKISPTLCEEFITSIEHLNYRWFSTHGFSMGISDCMINDKKEFSVAVSNLDIDCQRINKTNTDTMSKERKINEKLNSVMNTGLSIAKNNMNKGNDNAFKIMMTSGAKGSAVNCFQITCCIGQQNVEGKRMPLMLGNKSRSLSHFSKNDNSPEARGFVYSSYMKGLNTSEMFFHSAGGREGLISTAIKSVSKNTLITIIENGKSKIVKIGEWIDDLMDNNKNRVEHRNERDMELLELENQVYIPTCDLSGNVCWASMTFVTRHDSGPDLYKIKTYSGRSVTVVDSNSLLIWNGKSFEPKKTSEVKIGDFVPVISKLVKEQPIVKNYIDMTEYFPKTEFNLAEIPDKFLLNEENGIFIGLFLANGNIENDYVQITKNNTITRNFVKNYFNKMSIKFTEIKTCFICGYSRVFAKFLTKLVGRGFNGKFVPNEAFTAPKEFIIGLLNGYISGDGYVYTNQHIGVGSVCKKLIIGISMLFSLVGIVGRVTKTCIRKNILYYYTLRIKGQWATKFQNIFNLLHDEKNLKLQNMKPSKTYKFFKEENDVVLDKIVKIKKLENLQKHPKMYDVTVPKTFNFSSTNGLCLVDTAEVGKNCLQQVGA